MLQALLGPNPIKTQLEKYQNNPTEELNFFGLAISELPDYFSQTIAPHASIIKLVSLDFNKFTDVPEAFFALPNLTEFNISNNAIVTLPDKLLSLPLTSLNISHNKLANSLELTEKIGKLCKNLTELDMSSTLLAAIHPAFGELRSLQILDVSFCNLEGFPLELLTIASITELNLAHNSINVVPDEIANLQNLVTLKMDYCGLKYFPESIFKLPKLEIIHLAYNSLTSLPESGWTNFPNIKKLDFAFNDISAIPDSLISYFVSSKSIELFQLVGNPLQEDFNDTGIYPFVSYKHPDRLSRPSCIIEHKDGLGGVYLGSQQDSINKHGLKNMGVTHILTVADGIRSLYPNYFEYKIVAVDDNPSVELSKYFKDCIEFIHTNRLNGKSTLVHCVGGVSRSATITIAYLMSTSNLSYEDAKAYVCERRPVVNPNSGFCKQLQEFNKTTKNGGIKEVCRVA